MTPEEREARKAARIAKGNKKFTLLVKEAEVGDVVCHMTKGCIESEWIKVFPVRFELSPQLDTDLPHDEVVQWYRVIKC